tara:strand:- start:1716 stop:2696 length:981 start_codon:yes stop_codon:yes gene_type:complete
MKKCIVTGGLGFIGSHLVEKLVDLKYKVIVIDNCINGKISNISNVQNKVKIFKNDISKKGDWQNAFKNADVVFHLAALADIVPSINNPLLYFNTNVKGTLNVLEYSKKYKIKKFIYAASSSCYGIPKKYPTDENEKLDPKYPYSLTKKIGEDLVLHWGNVFKLNVTSLRFFNIYGIRSRTTGSYGAMFGVFLAQKINNKNYTVVGNGRQKRDFIYISDVVEAILKSSRLKKKNLVLNIGSGKCYSINYIVKLLGGKKTYLPKRPGEPDITWSNIKKAKKILNWKPKVTIEDGVKILLKNINLWNNAPLWSKDKIKIATKDWFKYLK